MKHYKVKKEHNDHFEVHDARDGRTFKVAKKGLGALEKKVRKMADGGVVENDEEAPELTPGNYFPIETSGDIPQTPIGEPGWNPNMQPAGTQPGADIFASNPNTQVMHSPGAVGAFPGRSLQVNPNTAQPQGQQDGGMQLASAEMAMPPPAAVDTGLADATAAVQKGIQAQQTAATAQAKIASDYTQQVKDLQGATQANYAALESENKQLQDDITGSKIDPHRLWNGSSTGNKVLAGIGVLLSGIGSGLTGQKNMALEVINRAIDADIDAQKSELGKKQNLLTMNYRKYGDLQTAQAATAAQLSSVAQAQIAAAAAKSGSAQAQLNGSLAIAQLKQQEAQKIQAVAMQTARTAIYNQGGGQNITPATAELVAPGQWVNTPAGIKIAKTPDAAKKLGEALELNQTIDRKINDMLAFTKEVGSTAPGSDNAGRAKSMQNDLLFAVKNLAGLGVLSGPDVELATELAPDPGQWRTSKAQAQLMQLRTVLKDKLQAAYANQLVNPQGLTTPPTAREDQGTGMSLTKMRRP